ncbi:glycosyltransferase family 4 protein [Luteibacter rhizovicinus]|nr:glycosyltransferase family 1 protein [Luteibacter rhizovicinus]
MQGVQTDSRHRGIGRYCLAVTRAFLELGRDVHDTGLLFNAALDGIDDAMEALADVGEKVHRRAVGPIRKTSSDNPINDARRDAAERIFTHALNAGNPDVVWLSSIVEGFANDALVPHSTPDAFTVATLYDLIPLHDSAYLGHSRSRDWYMQRLEVLKRCDLLLAISEWVRTDAIARLGIDPDRIVAIGAGVETCFTPLTPGTDHTEFLRDRFGITRAFVMYNGGFDKRKNVISLIEAYAALPEKLRAEHILVVVGRVDLLQSERFAETIAALHLHPDEVVFTGFVSDTDLVRLYQSCALFVFPSKREGFGLTPLEAMACGAPTLVNDATSLPEVVADPEALFNADQPGAITARIQAVLTDSDLEGRLRRSGLSRSSHFSWRAVATRALAAIETHATEPGARRSRDDTPLAFDLPIYRVDAANVSDTLPILRRWPGSVIWSGPLPTTGPSLAADRFRLGGYARLDEPGSGNDWIALLEEDAIGVLRGETLPDDALQTWLKDHQWSHPLARQRAVEQAIAGPIAAALSDDDLACVADALTRATHARHARWLVDVTHIAANDLGTGVHRVVRSILREWLVHPPEGIRIEPIAFREGRFHHAHDYACELIGTDAPGGLPGDLVAITGNEVYIGLDWAMESLPSSAPLLRTWRRAGVPMHFVVYDLLPLTMPDAFHAQSCRNFASWMVAIAGLGDVLHCISRSTASDVTKWLSDNKTGRIPKVTGFELGAEPGEERRVSELDSVLKEAMSASPSLLMVGTVEPRKGHVQVLDALELLWESGVDVILIIVGHRGWLVKDLIERLQQHREKGRRLFWLDDADDDVLEAVYRQSTVLVAASRGEGYGLPLIEAARRGKPVIARALPVFREVAGDYPSYFNTDSPAGLATHLARWLVDRPPPGPHPTWVTWRQSAHLLKQSIMSTGHDIAPS